MKFLVAPLRQLHLLVAIILAIIFGTFFTVFERRTYREHRHELETDIATAQMEIQTRLRDANDYFTLLGDDLLADHLPEANFQSRAAQFIEAHPEIMAIGWINEEEGVNWMSPSSVTSFALLLQNEEFKRAASLARDGGDFAISSFFRTFTGEKSFALFVPIYKGNSFLGSFFGIYSVETMLHTAVPDWIDERYELSFVDSTGQTIVKEAQTHHLEDDLVTESRAVAPGFPVRLRIQRYHEGLDWQNMLLMALSLGVVTGVGLGIRELNHDRSLKKDLAEQMRVARDLAESANQTKTEFVAKVSHELRTPIAAILGFTDLLLRDLPTPRDLELNLQHITRNGQSLLMLIDDLLDHSKLETGYLTVRKEQLDLRELLMDVVLSCVPQARSKDLSVIVRTETPLPRIIENDGLRIKQILINILSNAIKFTPKGQVRLLATLRGEGDSQNLEFRIIDEGIGIAIEHQEKVFEAFSQADPGISRQFGGTGLGLAIASKIAHLLGGKLTLESSHVNEGSCFLLTLPLAISQTNVGDALEFELNEWEAKQVLREPLPSLARLDGKRILVVEDSPDIQNLIREYLRRCGASVCLLGDGEKAVELGAKLFEFDAILMDIQLPGQDGYATTKAIRDLGVFPLPIIALTAHAGPSERGRALVAGCDEYLSKPFEPQALISVLQRLFESNIAPPLSASPPQRTGQERKKNPIRSQLEVDGALQLIVSNFVQHLPARLQQFDQTITREDWDRLHRLAHTLKGTAANFGFPQMARAAGDLEAAALHPDRRSLLSKHIHDINDLTERMTQGLPQ